MPHVRFMLTAMWDRDRTTALEHGETTLWWLNWSGQDRPNSRSESLSVERLGQEWQIDISADAPPGRVGDS